MPGRFAFPLAAVLTALCAWSWLPARSIEPAHLFRQPELESGRYYVAEIAGGTATIELPDLVGPCDLIVSSLGEFGRTYRVQLAAAPSAGLPGARLSPVSDLPEPHGTTRLSDARASLSASGSAVAASCEPAGRSFPVHIADLPLEDRRAYARVDATLAGEGRRVRVFLDRQLNVDELASGLVDAIVEQLDERIIPHSASFFGVHRDIDGDGKLAILLTPWLERLQGGKASVRGFVRSSDFQPDGDPPFGIRSDVIYLNSNLHPDPALTALLAHEYTHAVCCSLRLSTGEGSSPLPTEEDWLNEAIAHVAEQQHGAGWSNLDRRVQAYLEAPEQAPLVVADYWRAGLWRDDSCRGATFLFLQWCVDAFGPHLLRELACHPETGARKLEAVTGQPFEELYRRWTIAVHRGRLDSVDLHGTLGECRLHGAAVRRWRAAEGPCELNLRGTTSAYVRIEPEPGKRVRSVRVTAERGARLQVTLVRPVTWNDEGQSLNDERKK